MISKHQNPFTAQAISSAGDSIVLHSEKSPQWTLPHIKSILRNEKYCGDVLMQKTFQQDVINRKVIKNTGQLPMYLIENHHEGIVSREKYNAVQAEMARRKAAKSPSKRASTGLAAYTSRYALSDRLVCGECGTLYRRCTWTRPDGKRVVWRCVSRLDYGKKYCHSSPTLDEAPLQQVQSLWQQIVDHEGDRLVSGALQRVRVNGLQSFDLRHKKPPDKRIRAETSLQSRL